MKSEESKPAPPVQPAAPEALSQPTAGPKHKRRRWFVALGVLVALAVLFLGIPRVLHALNTVSTDDAYVNSYVTFVAPRVTGQVARVLVDDNNRVKIGDVLVELDPEPYRVQVAIKQAAVDSARADLVAAQATVRSLMAQARSQRFKLIHAIEDVDNQVALVRARAATWEQSKAALVLAQAEFDRAKRLLESKVVSAEEFDQKREALDAAQAEVTQTLENVYQARARRKRRLPRRWKMSIRRAPLSACQENHQRERASSMCLRISTRPSPRSAKLWQTCFIASRSSASCHCPTISRRSRRWKNSISAIPAAISTASMRRS